MFPECSVAVSEAEDAKYEDADEEDVEEHLVEDLVDESLCGRLRNTTD